MLEWTARNVRATARVSVVAFGIGVGIWVGALSRRAELVGGE